MPRLSSIFRAQSNRLSGFFRYNSIRGGLLPSCPGFYSIFCVIGSIVAPPPDSSGLGFDGLHGEGHLAPDCKQAERLTQATPQENLERRTTPSIAPKAALPHSANLTVTTRHPNKVRKPRKVPVDSQQRLHRDENTLHDSRSSVSLFLPKPTAGSPRALYVT